MTEPLFLSDPYLREAPGRVVAAGPQGIVLDASIFYAASGGQPGDTGSLEWAGRSLRVRDTVKGEGGSILLIPEEEALAPLPEMSVRQRIDWNRRHALMRCHTALHLLSVVLPFPVTGGAVGEGKGRLDFDMEEPPEDPTAIETALGDLVARDLAVTAEWVGEDVLDVNPALVKTMSVKPPRGSGLVRLVRIGEGAAMIDLQPCGGTHVRSTGEIGPVRLGRIEKKGRRNRRVTILLT